MLLTVQSGAIAVAVAVAVAVAEMLIDQSEIDLFSSITLYHFYSVPATSESSTQSDHQVFVFGRCFIEKIYSFD